MKVYTCIKFRGLWPAGTAAVITAPNRSRAIKLLLSELKALKLDQTEDDIKEIRRGMVEISTTEAAVHILRDGNY